MVTCQVLAKYWRYPLLGGYLVAVGHAHGAPGCCYKYMYPVGYSRYGSAYMYHWYNGYGTQCGARYSANNRLRGLRPKARAKRTASRKVRGAVKPLGACVNRYGILYGTHCATIGCHTLGSTVARPWHGHSAVLRCHVARTKLMRCQGLIWLNVCMLLPLQVAAGATLAPA